MRSAQGNHFVWARYEVEGVVSVRCPLSSEIFQHGWMVGTPIDKDMVNADLNQRMKEERGGSQYHDSTDSTAITTGGDIFVGPDHRRLPANCG